MATDDVVPLYYQKQKFGKFNVFLVLEQKNGNRSREDKLISVYSTKKEAQMFISKKQGW